MHDRKLLTPNQLATMANLSLDQYDTEYLQRFINYYDLAEDNVNSLNIELLLSDFDALDQAINVQSIFTDPISEPLGQKPENITNVALYINTNTSIESVYYDFPKSVYYKAQDMDLFFDLTQASPKTVSAQELATIQDCIVELGVLDWKDKKTNEDNPDQQSMCIAIRFSDGSLFRVSASGILSECELTNFEEVYALLLGQ